MAKNNNNNNNNWGPPRLPAHCDGNVGRPQFLSPPIPLQCGPKNFWQLRRG